MEENSNQLWSDIGDNSQYKIDPSLYQTHILEQYKIYVEMADKISERRNLTNVFFLSVNTTLITLFSYVFKSTSEINPKWMFVFPVLAMCLLCFVWWHLLRSYRQLNSAKYKVIGELERQLPASPYWSAEWKYLGEGKDTKKYFPLTHLEHFVPIIFGFLYLSVYIMTII